MKHLLKPNNMSKLSPIEKETLNKLMQWCATFMEVAHLVTESSEAREANHKAEEAKARASEARSYAYMAQLRTEEAAHRAQLSYNRLATVAVAMAIGAPLLLGLIVVLTSII